MANENARRLRRDLTDAERFVWQRLRSGEFAGYKFRRQMPIGSYIVDFVCPEKRLIIELDGGQHVEQAEYDQARTDWLVSQGFRVQRYWNHEVFPIARRMSLRVVDLLELASISHKIDYNSSPMQSHPLLPGAPLS